MSSGEPPFEPDEITAFYDEHPYPPPVADLARKVCRRHTSEQYRKYCCICV